MRGGASRRPLLFWAISSLSQKEVAGRAIGFVILGVCIGAMIGLGTSGSQGTLGFLSLMDTVPGVSTDPEPTDDNARSCRECNPLPFFGPTAREKWRSSTRLSNDSRMVDSSCTIWGQKVARRINGQPVQGSYVLCDGDQIRLGGNILRHFNERARASSQDHAPAPVATAMPASPRPVSGRRRHRQAAFPLSLLSPCRLLLIPPAASPKA